MKLSRYSDLIRSLPINDHSFEVEEKNWEKHFKRNTKLKKLFADPALGKDRKIILSRKNIFEIVKNKEFDIDEFILKVLLWGYSKGGRGDNIKNVLDNFEDLKGLVNDLKENSKIDSSCKLKKCKGIGSVTITKFLYFLNAKYENYSCLILDAKVIKVLQNGIFDELKEIKKIKASSNGLSKNYFRYVKMMNEKAHKLEVKPDRLEMFLFMFGNHLKN